MQSQHAWCCGSADDCDSICRSGAGVTARSEHSILSGLNSSICLSCQAAFFLLSVTSCTLNSNYRYGHWFCLLSRKTPAIFVVRSEKCFCVEFSSTLSSSRSANGSEFPYWFSILCLYIDIYTIDSCLALCDSWKLRMAPRVHEIWDSTWNQKQINKRVYSHSFTPKKVSGRCLR